MKSNAFYLFSKKRIYLAICIGLSISGYLLYSEIKTSHFNESFTTINWTFKTFVFLIFAMIMMVIRDLAYVIRLRVLTDYKLSWKQAIHVILMWEFASAVSPGVVGGSAVAMFILHKEKIPIGKSTALVITTTLFDNLFYVLVIPIIVALIDITELIPSNLTLFGVSEFWFGYSILVLITIILSISLFIHPKLIKHLLLLIFKLPYLNKRKNKGLNISRDIILASQQLKGKSALFWAKLLGTTILSWTARFLVVNFILMAFVSLSVYQNLLVFARQLVMWLVLLISPTPGGSGVAEYLFSTFLHEFLPIGALIVITSIIWRMLSYYSYLVLGSIILPNWLNKR